MLDIFNLIQQLDISEKAKGKLWRGVKDNSVMTLDLFKERVRSGYISFSPGIGTATAFQVKEALKKLEANEQPNEDPHL